MKKNAMYLMYIAVAMLLMSCAAPRAGVAFGSERGESSIGPYSSRGVESAQLNISDTRSFTGFYVGVEFTDIDINEKFNVQPEVDFVYFDDWKMFQAPVLLNYEFFENFRGYFGPNATLLVDTPANLDSFGFGLDLGVSYNFTKSFSVEARYDYGLTDYSNIDGLEIKFSHFQVGAAYRFGE